MNASKYSLTSIQLANDSRRLKQSGTREFDGCFTFPAPATDLQKHGVASTKGQPGLWAYASNNAIVVVKSAELPRIWPLFIMLDGSGWDNYTSVSFCQALPEEWPIQDSPLVAASKAGLVRIFNIENNATVKFHTCHIEHRAIAEWSPRNYRLIYGTDDAGQLSIWDVVDNSCVLLSFGNLQTTCMAVSPVEDDIVALGDKDGSVRILSTTGTGSVLHTFKHSYDIYSVAWKPTGNWAVVTKLRKQIEPFLATSYTSVKPPCVKVCDREGKDIICVSQEESDGAHRRLMTRSIPSLWVHLPSDDMKGSEPHLALASVIQDGKILSWNALDTLPDTVHDLNHNCEVFALIQSGDILWSFSKEPYIIGWNLRSSKVEAIIPTYAGICSISTSSIEGTRLAIGGVDSYIRVLKVEPDYPNGKIPDMPLIPNRLAGKVTAVAWHPWMDKIGFGTDGGFLGVYDIKAESRHVMEFSKKISGTVYTVDWGPKCYSPDFQPKERPFKLDGDADRKGGDCLWLYACGNRSAFCIHPGRRDNALINVARIIGVTNDRPDGRFGTAISDIKWSPDHLYLAAGYTDGKIEIYVAPNLKLRCWIKCHSSAIQYLSWRSLDFVEEESEKREKFFASAANDGTAKVYNLAGLYGPDFLTNEEAPVQEFISSFMILSGHRGLRVIQAVWSPHNINHILTISYDRTAVIWDLKDKTRIARYMGHDHRLVACGFHPTNPYVVLTCSDEMVTDSCFHMWDYRQHPEVEKYTEKMALESMSGAKVECVKALAAPMPKLMYRPGIEDAAVGMDKKEKLPVLQDANTRLMSKIRDRMTLLPLTSHHKVENTLLQSVMHIIDGVLIPAPSSLTPYELSLIAEENKCPKLLSKIDGLVSQMEAKAVSGNLDGLPKGFGLLLYGSPKDAESLVQMEMENHIKLEDWASAICLLGCLPNPQEYIERIVAAGHIDHALVLFARKCSWKFHLEMSERYAAHLIKTGRVVEGIAYYWDVLESFDKAYEEMVKHDMLLDALAFSRLNRLDENWGDDLKLIATLAQRNVSPAVMENLYLAFGIDKDDHKRMGKGEGDGENQTAKDDDDASLVVVDLDRGLLVDEITVINSSLQKFEFS